MANDPHRVLTFDHLDGRKCTYMMFTGEWMHWDHEQPEPGPRERRSYVCNRQHPGDSSQMQEGDRGEFGMPTIGGSLYIGDSAMTYLSELERAHPHDHNCVRLTEKPTTGEGIRIIGQWLPETMERFLRNNTKYARAQKTDLGDKGIMPDINRKTAVLMDRIWFGADEVGESTVEVIDDLIGHLFLLRDKICTKEESDGTR